MEKDSCNEHFFVFSLHSTFKIFLEKSPVSPWPWIQCWKNDLTLFLSNNSWALLKLNHRSGQQEMYIWNPTSLYMRSSVLTSWEQFTFISFFRLKKKKKVLNMTLNSLYSILCIILKLQNHRRAEIVRDPWKSKPEVSYSKLLWVQWDFEYLQGSRLHYLPRQPLLQFDCLQSKEHSYI